MATRVLATAERGFVQWDKKAYRAHAEQAVTEYIQQRSTEAAMEALEKARANNVPPEELPNIYRIALANTRSEIEKKRAAMVAEYPTEPEIEYAGPDEVLPTSVPEPVAPSSLNQIYQQHWQDAERGELSFEV